jgi:hypothetical protein
MATSPAASAGERNEPSGALAHASSAVSLVGVSAAAEFEAGCWEESRTPLSYQESTATIVRARSIGDDLTAPIGDNLTAPIFMAAAPQRHMSKQHVVLIIKLSRCSSRNSS